MLSRPSRIAKAKLIQEVDESSELSDSSTSSSNDKAPVPPRKSSARPRDPGQDDEDDDDDESDESESDEPTAPPVKRRRKTRRNAPMRNKGKGRGYAGKLSKLPELSLDVLFTIFGLLHPKDLMHLSCVSKLFRDMLLAPSASSIWINSRKDVGHDCPAPGEGLSECYWAHLIWNRQCSSCKASDVPLLDFAWRKRICRSCSMQYSTRRNEVPKLFPKYNILVLDLIPRSSDFHYTNLRRLDCFNHVWTKDIKRVGTQLRILERNARKTPDGQNALNEYIEERKRFVKSVQDYANVCKEWYRLNQTPKDTTVLTRERRTEIFRRFEEIGYNIDDIFRAVKWQSSCCRPKELTSRSWAIIRPALERDILVARAKAFPNGVTKDQRFDLLDTVYQRYKQSNFSDSHDWISLPHEHIVRKMAIFNELLYTSPDTQLKEQQFQDIIDHGKLDIGIQKFKLQKERALKMGRSEIVAFLSEEDDRPIKEQYKALELVLLPSSATAASSSGSKNSGSTTRSRGERDMLNLALSVFACCQGCYHADPSDSILIGGEAIERHIPIHVPNGGYLLECDTYSKLDDPWQNLTVLKGARQVLLCLLETLKIDKVEGWEDKKVEQITIEEMDRLDARWICEKCFEPPEEVQGGDGKQVVHDDDGAAGRRYLVCHWRAAFIHCLSWNTLMWHDERSIPYLQHVPKFKLLSPRDTECVKNELEVEQWNMILNDQLIWWCTKCVLDKPLSRSDVLEHVKATHVLIPPPLDFFFF